MLGTVRVSSQAGNVGQTSRYCLTTPSGKYYRLFAGAGRVRFESDYVDFHHGELGRDSEEMSLLACKLATGK